jgi:cyclase
MLRSRIIPVLLIQNKSLVKTIQFKDAKYVGDPLNAVRIFSEKEADELMVLDIDATVKGHEPDYNLIQKLAAECQMPLCYGGGVKTLEQAKRILSLGVEKVSIGSALFEHPELATQISRQVGRQSVVAVLDVKNNNGKYECFIHNGTKGTKVDPVSFAKKMEAAGVGEIVINSIDNDGLMKGYDYELARLVKSNVTVPLTVVGGAGSYDDISQLIKREGLVGAAAGSLFVFKGKFRAVLISYPKWAEREIIFSK